MTYKCTVKCYEQINLIQKKIFLGSLILLRNVIVFVTNILPSSAQLNPTPTSVGWAEIALISTFTPPHPQGKYRAQLSPAQSNSNAVGWANRKQNKLKASLSWAWHSSVPACFTFLWQYRYCPKSGNYFSVSCWSVVFVCLSAYTQYSAWLDLFILIRDYQIFMPYYTILYYTLHYISWKAN